MTHFVIRHRTTRLYWLGSARVGDLWGGLQLAKRFDGMSTAFAAGLFECHEPEAAWDVVAVEGV